MDPQFFNVLFAFVCVLFMQLYVSLQNLFLIVHRYVANMFHVPDVRPVANLFDVPDFRPIPNAPPANLFDVPDFHPIPNAPPADLPRHDRTRYGLRNVIHPPRRF